MKTIKKKLKNNEKSTLLSLKLIEKSEIKIRHYKLQKLKSNQMIFQFIF